MCVRGVVNDRCDVSNIRYHNCFEILIVVEREEQERRAEKLVPSTLERLCSNEEEYYYLSYAIYNFLCDLQYVTSEYMSLRLLPQPHSHGE